MSSAEQPADSPTPTQASRPWKRWLSYAATALVALVLGAAIAQPETKIKTETTTRTVTAPSPEGAARDSLKAEVEGLQDAARDARSSAREAKSDRRTALSEQRAAEKRSEGRLATLRKQAQGVRSEIARSRFDGDGTFLVGDDIVPGIYKAESVGGNCYWERTSSDSDIIDNNNTSGNAVITVAPTDFSITTSGCGEFTKAGG